MARNYAAEYARRIELGETRGASRAASRGHQSYEVENARRRTPDARLQAQLNYYTKATVPKGMAVAEYRKRVREGVERVGKADTLAALRRKKAANDYAVKARAADVPYDIRRAEAKRLIGFAEPENTLLPLELLYYNPAQ